MKQKKYKASIIVPTYNRADTLKKCLLAIEKQTCSKKDFEVIIINDGSTDGTESFLKEYHGATPLPFKYFSQQNLGPAAARNKGIKNAQGHIVILIGDDMMMAPDCIEKHLDFHGQWLQDTHACLGFIDWSKEREITPLMTYITTEGGQQFSWNDVFAQDQDTIGYDFFWSSNISIKKSFLLNHGLFNEKIFKHAMWEDIELGFRLEQAGLQLHVRKNCLVCHDHGIHFKDFAERQRMVGWYSYDIEALGMPTDYVCKEYEKERIFSHKALMEIIDVVEAYEKEKKDTRKNNSLRNRLYGYALRYAGRVGYEERRHRLKNEVGGVAALLINLSLADEKIEKQKKKIVALEKKLREKG